VQLGASRVGGVDTLRAHAARLEERQEAGANQRGFSHAYFTYENGAGTIVEQPIGDLLYLAIAAEEERAVPFAVGLNRSKGSSHGRIIKCRGSDVNDMLSLPGVEKPLRSAPEESDARWRREMQRGLRRLAAGDREGARAAFAKAHALAPDEAEPAFALGREEWRRGRVAEAERLLRLAFSARPSWALGAAALARVLIERDRLDEAEKILETALAQHPKSPALLVVRGEVLLDRDRPEDAAQAFLAAREEGADAEVVNAGLARAENARGLGLSSQGSDTEAAFAFKRAADLDERWAPPRANLGALLHRMGKPTAALAQYRLALRLDPGHVTARFNLGLLHRDQGELGAAARAFAAAMRADPPHPEARRQLALLYAERGEFLRAAELFEAELRATRRPDAGVYANLGLALAKGGELARAEAALLQALQLDPGHAEALTNLAALYEATGRSDEALRLRNLRGPTASKD
jgi:tetratricopeptide (TPR) repeat protein